MKKTTLLLATIATTLTITSCSDKDVPENIIPDDQKGLIEFSATAETGSASSSAMTRAGFTGGAEFASTNAYSTEIVARFSSTDGTSTRHTKTSLTASYDSQAEQGANMATCSGVEYTSGNERFWDDAFGRDAKLSIYAVAVPNKSSVTNNSTTLFNLVQKGNTNVSAVNANWQTDAETDALNSIAWQVATTQTDTYTGTIATEDLCYSHNIQSATDNTDALQYGKGKDGVRVWGAHDAGDRDEKGYPKYKWDGDATDHYPTLDNGQMMFRLTNTATDAPKDGPGHFDKGHMIFRHALTRITVNLKKSADDGFSATGSFVLTDDLITLLNMHYKGTLNIKDGTWSAYTEGTNDYNANIKMASKTANTGMDYTNFAQVIPGYTLGKTSDVNVMKFTVSDNTYYITQKQLFAALNTSTNTEGTDANGNKLVTVKDDKITLEQGKNYIFTITVKKSGIQSITASLVPWVEVTGETDVKNDYVKISLLDKTNTACEHFDLYRMNDDQTNVYAPTTGPGTGEDWTKNYNWYGTAGTAESQNYKDKATLTASSTANVWKTNWFWESNKSFYHFRTVNTGMAIQANTTTAEDYFNIYGGPIQDYDATHTEISTEQNASGKVNDYHWGAPFKPESTLTYSPDYGWSAETDAEGQIYPAIGATSGTINMIEHHMMSNIRIILKTKKDESNTTGNKLGAGAVDLQTADVILTNFANEGTVEMGRGLVTPSTTMVATQSMTVPTTFFKTAGDNTETNAYTYRVVPQALYRTTTPSTEADLTKFIGLTIKTADNNQYYVIKNLSEITASGITNQGSKTELTTGGKILRWFPGYDYTYTITISKTGIESITCTIVDWVKVTADNINIGLED